MKCTRFGILLAAVVFLGGCGDSKPEPIIEAEHVESLPDGDHRARVFVARDPAPDMRSAPQVVRDVPVLDDTLRAEMADLERLLADRPTTEGNAAERIARLLAYYDALQGAGVLLNYQINMTLNGLSAALAPGLPLPPPMQSRLPLLADLLRELRAADAARGRTGEVLVRAPESDALVARSFTTLVLEYRVGELPIVPGGRIRIGYNWYVDVGDVQFSRPLDPGYTTVTSSRAGVRLAYGPEYWFGQQFSALGGAWTRSVAVLDGTLEPGDTVTLTIGDRSAGSPGWLVQSSTIDTMDLRLEVDFEGDGVFVPVAQPRFRVVGAEPHHLRVVAPSVVRPGESVALRVNVEDRYFNEAATGPDELIAFLDGTEVARAAPLDGVPGRFHFPSLPVPADTGRAPLYYEVRDGAATLLGVSNPVVVRPAGEPRLFWGETHGHEGYTDGNGTPEWYLGYARDVAFLDFAALTGHDLMLSELHFRDVLRVTREFNDPARGFVTFPAYEWTMGWQNGGHHNVFYQDESQRVLTTAQTGTLTRLFDAQRRHNDPDKVLIIPHAHMPGDWASLESDLGPLVEIYSTHGSFEWFGRRYLQAGHLVGFNAASDDHIGHPGNAPARAQARGGIAAVFADTLDREPVFSALKARHTYGTSLARIYLDTRVGGARMGQVTALAPDGRVEASAEVAGTAPIASVTWVVNGVDAVSQDYATARVDTGRLWFRITASSEPDNPAQPRSPRNVVRYIGTVELEHDEPGVLISAMTPLGTEPYGDTEALVSGRRASFSWRVRGDYDAMLLDLAAGRTPARARVRVWKLPLEAHENWNLRRVPQLPGEFERQALEVPGGILLAEQTVELDALLAGAASGPIEDGSSWALSFVERDLPTWRELAQTLAPQHGIDPGRRNHVYLRVKQLDDETAWSSPTFLEQAR